MVFHQMKLALNRFSITLISIIIILLQACGGSSDAPNVDNIQVSLNARRLDKDLAAIDTNNITTGLQTLSGKYPDFLIFYLDTLMAFNIQGVYTENNPGIQKGLRTFLTYSDYRNLFDSVAKHFPDTKSIDAELVKGFKYMKYYFPQYKVPKIIYLTSGLNNYAAFTYGEDIVGIGLDMFLGEQYPFYAAVGLPAYSVRRLKPEYVPVNVFQSVYRLDHPFVMESRSLLDMMIQLGKEQYFLSKVLPFVHDTTRIGYTRSQLEWCEASEEQVYNFFVQQKLLYETSWQKMIRYVNDGPSAAGMPAESPGNIGIWVGYQIVKAYVAEHPDITLPELIKPVDAQQFLTASKYKPR